MVEEEGATGRGFAVAEPFSAFLHPEPLEPPLEPPPRIDQLSRS